MAISADSPELKAFAMAGDIDPEKMAAAFNDPEHLFDHLTLAEIARFKIGCDRLVDLQKVMLAAMDQYMAHARAVLADGTSVSPRES